jgi:hypothetical protein
MIVRTIKHTMALCCVAFPFSVNALAQRTLPRFGFTDMLDKRLDGNQKLSCELTIKDGKIVYDLNGISASLWTAQPDLNEAEAYRWTTFAPHHPSSGPHEEHQGNRYCQPDTNRCTRIQPDLGALQKSSKPYHILRPWIIELQKVAKATQEDRNDDQKKLGRPSTWHARQ